MMASLSESNTSRLALVSKALPSFPPRSDYSSLSIRDLVEAREAYHIQLSSLDNVVATAIGRYLIRADDWYAEHAPNVPRPADVEVPSGARTLANSVVRPWSWPAVLVFVRTWDSPGRLGPHTVPSALYLPDGRVIPTCVIQATPDESLPLPAAGPAQVSSTLGGGYSCLRTDQGLNQLGTFACLVYREGSFYALTNRHVAGPTGSPIRAFVAGEYVAVGVSADIGVSRVPFSKVFPAWPGAHTQMAFDAGLVRVDDVTNWTSQAFGIGEIGEVFDATEHTLSLDLIGLPVRAFGGTSGVMMGEIAALFFRYKSGGGIDYATDLLIGARGLSSQRGSAPPLTRPGDSGTLWFYDPPSDPLLPPGVSSVAAPDRGVRARRLRPIAMQWGGERFVMADGTSSAFALASFLSTICRELDVEINRSWSLGHSEYWGKLGHFAIGWKACDLVKGKLGSLMRKNQARIGFGDEDLGKGKQFKMGAGDFVPLADVPDYVWVIAKGSHPFEGIQHFADVDIQDIAGGPSLLDQCVADPHQCAASVWKAYFDGFKAAGVGPDAGTLPFRVWQIWEAMVGYAKAGDVIHFVAAAGVLSHYVGDASQPLHCSYLHHGVPPMLEVDGRPYPVRKESAEFKAFSNTPEYKIHGLYEEGMIEVDTPTVLAKVNAALTGVRADPNAIASGHAAAVATIKLMHDAQARLAPGTIIDADDPTLGPTERATRLWNNKAVKAATITSLAESVSLLANLWAGAWAVGGGEKILKKDLPQFTEPQLVQIYAREKGFLQSLSLDQMAASGKFEH
jgi:hypothetical protein